MTEERLYWFDRPFWQRKLPRWVGLLVWTVAVVGYVTAMTFALVL